ncbi:dienelactone hydrolase family protein [Noviherbaspirillum massiliense]|uniref:dienelactone hydrolase family protein n=1 Tax=Noviherbaspirillum massiliense TaxID=1465823 RepID=UPI001375D132|nr:CocE/NonD family hydrolase [Noviherbaspirillum massiliense]
MTNSSPIQAKKSRKLTTFLAMAVLGLSLVGSPYRSQAVTLNTALNEQVVMVPVVSGGDNVQLETTIFTPPGPGPFPLVVMNHGKALGDPHNQGRDRFVVISREFVKRGYAVVVPMRKGFAESTGEYVEHGCDMIGNGQTQADDLQGVLEYLRTQPWVDKDRIIVAGQSYGGLATIAFGTRSIPGVKGLINFAGGLKMHGAGCDWQDSLVKAFNDFGAKTTLPSIWFYGQNDQHFGPELAARLRDAYVSAGGHAKLVAYGAFKNDAHGMAGSRDGVQIWWPETEKFLKELGMPTEEVVALSDEPQVAATNYASLDNVDAVPYLRDRGRQQYKEFLSKPLPRAFALSSSGAWSWAEDGDDPPSQVLADCQKTSQAPCKLYAVDNAVVWNSDK